MSKITIECDKDDVSDGYHTFAELYEHRYALTLALMKSNPKKSWVSRRHHDGKMFQGMFITGIKLPQGQISYHLPNRLWKAAVLTKAKVLRSAPLWDGHDSDLVVRRLIEFAKC